MTLEVLRSDLLDTVQHGFFTRKGGASSGLFEGLNCGAGSSDQRHAVETNRARVAQHMGMAPADLVTVNQTHSAIALPVEAPFEGPPPEADGIATKTPGLLLGILTADCQPVLFADQDAGVVGAAHAGWKGAMGGVLEATLDVMEALGARRERIVAVIGPSISQPNYEVGDAFMEQFVTDASDSAQFFDTPAGGKPHFDLTGYGLHRLRKAGVGKAAWTGHCTYADSGRFYSFRRATHLGEPDYGRLIATIRL